MMIRKVLGGVKKGAIHLGGAIKSRAVSAGMKMQGYSDDMIEAAMGAIGHNTGTALKGVDDAIEAGEKAQRAYANMKQTARGRGVIQEARPVSGGGSDTVSKAIQYESAAKEKYGFEFDGVQYLRKGDGSADSPYQYYSRTGKGEWGAITSKEYGGMRGKYISSQRAAGAQADINDAYKIATTGAGDHAGFDLGQAIQDHPVVAMGIAAGGGILAANLFDDDDY